MRCISTILLLLSFTSLGIAADPNQKPVATPVSGKIDWVFDYGEGKTLSRATGKPMFVVFRCER